MADLDLSIRVENLDSVRDALRRLSGRQAKEAYAKAINDTGFRARRAMQRELASVFDRPTRFITSAPKLDAATADRLSARIIPTLDTRNRPGTGGKIGVDPQQVLQAQEFGGRRADKRSEVRLRRLGYLPAGFQTVIPEIPFPGSHDGKGNLRGAFLQQMLSYLQAYSEAGSSGNMTARRRKTLLEGTRRQKAQGGPSLGRRYFVAGGRETMEIQGGDRMVMRRSSTGTTRHLRPGIWASLGQRGLRPVLMFVRAASYTPRLSMERIAAGADLQNYLDRRIRFRVREAAGL